MGHALLCASKWTLSIAIAIFSTCRPSQFKFYAARGSVRTYPRRDRPKPVFLLTGSVMSCPLRRVISAPIEELASFRYFEASLMRRVPLPNAAHRALPWSLSRGLEKVDIQQVAPLLRRLSALDRYAQRCSSSLRKR